MSKILALLQVVKSTLKYFMAKILKGIGITLYIAINYMIAGYFFGITRPYIGLIVLYIFGLFALSGLIISFVCHHINLKKWIYIQLISQFIINAIAALIALKISGYSVSLLDRGILFSLIGGLIFSLIGTGIGTGLIFVVRHAVRKSFTWARQV